MKTLKILLILLSFLFFSTRTTLGQADIPVMTLKGHTQAVNSVAFSPDWRYLASGSDDNTVRLWEVPTGKLVRTFGGLYGHDKGVCTVAFSPDWRYLASGSEDNTIRVWKSLSGQLLKTLEGHTGTVRTVAFSTDGRCLASGSDDKTIRLWDASSGELLRSVKGHRRSVLAVAFSPDGKYLASGSYDKTIKLWEVSSGQLVSTLKGPTEVNTVAFSADGTCLASGGRHRGPGHSIKLWDVSTGKRLKNLRVGWGTTRVFTVAFSPDGRYVASGGADKTIRLWEVSSGELFGTITGHANEVNSVAFSPDGRYLASGSSDHTIKLWDVSDLRVEAAIVSASVVEELPSSAMNVDINIPQGKVWNPKAVAVVIGNQKYEHGDVPPVEFAIDDASIFREYLVRTFGLKPVNIIFETDASLATFNSIFGTKDNPKGKLFRYVKPDESDVYIYYSGHGAPDPDTKVGYFLPVDCDPSVVALNGYSLDTFYNNLKKLPARSVTVIIDACFSGVSEGGPLLKGISPVFIEATEGAGLPNGTIFTSAEKDQVSTWYEEKRHSLFTYFFLSGLRGLADINKDGTITVGEMADFLQDRADGVPYWAGRLKNREQTPTVFGDRNRVLTKY